MPILILLVNHASAFPSVVSSVSSGMLPFTSADGKLKEGCFEECCKGCLSVGLLVDTRYMWKFKGMGVLNCQLGLYPVSVYRSCYCVN